MRKNDWTETELNFLLENYQLMGPTKIGGELNLTKRTIQNKAKLLNLKYIEKSNNELKEEFIIKANIIHGNKYNYTNSIYVNCRTKIDIECPEHGVFKQYPTSHIIHKQNCPICAKTLLNTDKLIKRFINKHGHKYNYDKVKYTGNGCYVSIICNIHGEFIQRHDSHSKGYGCHKCLNSLGEKETEKFLIKNNIKFISQHKFKNCKLKKELLFDFYLPDLNICIEFNGMQHYKSVLYWGGDDGLKIRKLRDKIKMEYCKNNNIPLIIIKYNDNILDKLKKLT